MSDFNPDARGHCTCGKELPSFNEHMVKTPHIPPSMYCSPECSRRAWDAAKADGRLIEIRDLTIEQTAELLGECGLGVTGVGERNPS